ncbi:MAG TPA: hypothetical protein VFX02_08640 [Gammaproteobacteria bacterium]|nr:hypothetical protein [Gammaproteobacteria bacterium]
MNKQNCILFLLIIFAQNTHAAVRFSENYENLKLEIGKTTRAEFMDKNSCVPYPNGIREGDRCECREKEKEVSECKEFWILRGELELENTKSVYFNNQGVLDFIEAPINVGDGAPVADIMKKLQEKGYSDISKKMIAYNESGFGGGPDEIKFGKDFIGVVWCHMEYEFEDKKHKYLLKLNGAFGDSKYTEEMSKAGVPVAAGFVNYKKLNSKLLSVLEKECKNDIVNGSIIIKNIE